MLIDGSEFTGEAELAEVYGAEFILLDDVNIYKNWTNLQKLAADGNYLLRELNLAVRNGFAVFEKILLDQTTFDARQKELAASCIRPGMTVLDTFADDGASVILFSKLVGPTGKVFALVGSASAGDALKSRLEKHHCTNVTVLISLEHSLGKIGAENEIGRIDFLRIQTAQCSSDLMVDIRNLSSLGKIGQIQIENAPTHQASLRAFDELLGVLKMSGFDINEKKLVESKVASAISDADALQQAGIAIYHAHRPLPIHFMTIVVNGLPFIKHHIEQFKGLQCNWHWHIVEGIAELKHDTAWSVQSGGTTEGLSKNARSTDGTSEYLDELKKQYPNQITIYRKPEGQPWDGKREMVNAPLANISEESLLFQIDVDELWTTEQLFTVRRLFLTQPEKTAARYWCWYYVGPDRIISTRYCYANSATEWLRTWRFKPGMFWAAHEPPTLAESVGNNQYRDVAAINVFSQDETSVEGLVFQHWAYATIEQAKFKEKYYGYRGAVRSWKALQAATGFPLKLADYFPWVKDDTLVDLSGDYVAAPLIALPAADLSVTVQKKINEAPTVVFDGVFFQIINTGIARVWRSLLREWSDAIAADRTASFVPNIIVVDRGGTAPKFPGIKYIQVQHYTHDKSAEDTQMLQQICDDEQADLFVSSYYTFPMTTPSIFMGYDMIPEVLGESPGDPWWTIKRNAISHCVGGITISHNTARDLCRLFPEVSPESVTVAHCAVDPIFKPQPREKIDAFKLKYGITRPYFLLVGIRTGYKGAHLLFQALSRLSDRSSFEIVCVGGMKQLEPQLAQLAGNTPVKLIAISDEELTIAYSGAIALAYPSKYEGFGLPVLEAMASGCPVITCALGSIPEVSGDDGAVYVPHGDLDALAKAMVDVRNPEIRKKLIDAGLERSKMFSWRKMAEIVGNRFRQTAIELRKSGGSAGPLHTVLCESASRPDKSYLLSQLREIRFNLAQSLLEFDENIPIGNTSAAAAIRYIPGHLLITHRLLSHHAQPLRYEKPNEAEQKLAKRILDIPADLDWTKSPGRLMAAMLLLPAHQIPNFPKCAQCDRMPETVAAELVQYAIKSPEVFTHIGEADQFGQFYTNWLTDLHNHLKSSNLKTFWQSRLEFFATSINMIASYFSSGDLKEAMSARAGIIEMALRKVGFQLDHTFGPHPVGRKIRVGVLLNQFAPHTETYAALPIFENLDRSRIEIILYALNRTSTPVENQCAQLSDRFIILSGSVNQQATMIRNDDLDFLFFGTNISAVTHPSVVLAAHRLARMQLAYFTCPVTTGFTNMDYFALGCGIRQEADARNAYTEKLGVIEEPGMAFNFRSRPPQSNVVVARQSLGISDSAMVFISGANFFKITPELREQWVQLLKATPHSMLLLYPFGPSWSNQYAAQPFMADFHERLKSHGLTNDRLVCSPSLPSSSDVQKLLSLADVYLDSFPYSGALSIIDALEAALPCVAVDGLQQRFGQSTQLLRALNLPHLIAKTPDQYMSIARGLGIDAAKRKAVSEEVKQAMASNPKFLDTAWYGKQMQQFFERAMADWSKALK